MNEFRLGLLQIHPVVGDIRGNARRLAELLAEAADAGCDLAVSGELAICGYPPQSLIVDEGMLRAVHAALDELGGGLPDGLVALIGAPRATAHARGVHNAVAVVTSRGVVGWADKQHLPTYALFDEGRYFVPSRDSFVVELPDVRVGVMVCADLWEPEPSAACASMGADLLVALNASPYSPGMQRRREATTITRALEHTVPVAYANLVGGQDGIVFDGGSHLTDHAGFVVARGPALEEALVVCDVDVSLSRRSARAEPHRRAASRPAAGPVRAIPVDVPRRGPASTADIATRARRRPDGVAPWPAAEEHRWRVAGVALRDFTAGLGVERVLVGLDGTLGAGLTALLACRALGPDRTVLVDALPATVDEDDDRRTWATRVLTAAGHPGLLPLPPVHVPPPDPVDPQPDADAVAPPDPDAAPEAVVPDEDPAVRLVSSRATLLALRLCADGHDAMLLSSADRTMRALGGGWPHELAGGFAPLGDLTRGWLLRIAEWHGGGEVPLDVPASILARASETIGGPRPLIESCALLDEVVEGYIDDNQPRDALADRRGLDQALVAVICDRIDGAEATRRQLPLAPRASGRALSDDRRMPVVWRRGWDDGGT
ncbi:MAG: nitrilase-related carbon-nitrogen hydrolase [Solirubrobacteraceae bacterium]